MLQTSKMSHQNTTINTTINYLLVPTVETVSCCCATIEEDFSCTPIETDDFCCAAIDADDCSCTPIETDDFCCAAIDADDFCCTPIETDDFCCAAIDTDDFCCTPIETDDFCCAAIDADDCSCTPIETDDFCCVGDDCLSSTVGLSGLKVTMSFSELESRVVEAPGELPMGGQYSKVMFHTQS